MKITKKMMIKFRAFSLAMPARQTCHAGVADVPCRRGKPFEAIQPRFRALQ